MNNDQEMSAFQFGEIERYLMHEMSPEEEAAFRARLDTDALLKAKTEELKLIFLAIQESKLQSRLQQFHQEKIEKVSEGHVHIFNYGKRWLAAACVILAAGLAVWLFLKPAPEEHLYADYFKPDQGLISVMGISEQYAFDRAMIDYKTGNYKAAIKVWDSLKVSEATNDTLAYFIGSAYLGDNQPEKAIPYLQKVAGSESVFYKDANWYLGLALLKEKKRKEAIMYIEKSEHPEKQSLLDKLKKLK